MLFVLLCCRCSCRRCGCCSRRRGCCCCALYPRIFAHFLLFLFIGIGQPEPNIRSFLVCAQELTFYDELCVDSRWVKNAASGALMMPCAGCGTNAFSTMEKCTLINDTAGVKFVHGMSAPVVRHPPAPANKLHSFHR